MLKLIFIFSAPFFSQYRYDRANKRRFLNGYFIWLAIGYGVGKYSLRPIEFALFPILVRRT